MRGDDDNFLEWFGRQMLDRIATRLLWMAAAAVIVVVLALAGVL